MINSAGYSLECNILALIYINRIARCHKMPITIRNWRGLWIACVIIAHKFWEDCHRKMSWFVTILPNTTKPQLRDLERRAFILLKCKTTVRPSEYAKYYFELRTLYVTLVGPDRGCQFKMEPMTIAEARRLEYRTAMRATRARSTSISPPDGSPDLLFSSRSKTLEDLDDTKSIGRFIIS